MSTPESNIVTFKLELEVSSASLAIDAILGATQSKALADIIAERIRQVEAEGWTPEHDDKHERGRVGKRPDLGDIVMLGRKNVQMIRQGHELVKDGFRDSGYEKRDSREKYRRGLARGA